MKDKTTAPALLLFFIMDYKPKIITILLRFFEEKGPTTAPHYSPIAPAVIYRY